MTKAEMLSGRQLFIRNQHCKWDEWSSEYDALMYDLAQTVTGFEYDHDVDFGTVDLMLEGA